MGPSVEEVSVSFQGLVHNGGIIVLSLLLWLSAVRAEGGRVNRSSAKTLKGRRDRHS